MVSRAVSIIVSSWLLCFALILPLDTFHTINAIVAGSLATILAGFAMSHDRARYGAALVGAWVAFTPFIHRSSFMEIVVTVSWGVAMFVHLIGPFSETPHVTFVPAAKHPQHHAPHEDTLPLAA